MTDLQKAICRDLLKSSYETGFSNFYDLAPLAEKHGVQVEDLYNEDEQSGLLFDLGPYKEGFLSFSRNGRAASVCQITHELLEHWADYCGHC